jgi:hypothetical protein
VDASRVQLLRELLAATGWVERSREFAASLRRPGAERGSLLLVGTPQEEPWHLAAHLDDESRFAGLPELSPTLVRWQPPAGAPPHLSVGVERIEAARRGETLFVVAPDQAPERLLERVSDARRVGATILSLDRGDEELGAMAHDRLIVPPGAARELVVPALTAGPGGDVPGAALDMEVVQHLVSVAAGESPLRASLRDRLGRLLDRVSGPAPDR